jgi:hypothetical protein
VPKGPGVQRHQNQAERPVLSSEVPKYYRRLLRPVIASGDEG